jgi:hypothetical protein
MQHISGKSFDVTVGDYMLSVQSASVKINDGRKPVYDRGIPNGWVDGEVSADGEIELDMANFKILFEEAKKKKSWKAMEPFDIEYFSSVGTQEQKVQVYGCLLKISDLLSVDPKGTEKTTVKLPYEVTSPDFVKINGIPYLTKEETENLTPDN